MLTKICTGCKIEKDISLFPLKGHEPGRPRRLDSRCKQCKSAWNKASNKKKADAKRALLPPKHIPAPGFKTCTGCKTDKPETLEFFHKKIKNTNGFNSRCKDCVLANNRAEAEFKRLLKPPKKDPLSGTKTCRTCTIQKEWTEFRTITNKCGNKALYYQCKKCEHIRDVERYKEDPERHRVSSKKSRDKDPERHRANQRARYHIDVETSRAKGREKSRKPENKLKQKEWLEKNREHSRAYYRNKRKTDPLFRLAANLRSRTKAAFRKGSFTKNSSLSEYLGCSMEEFKTHLESLFQPGMTWDNYGRESSQWTLDHTIALTVAKTEEEMHKLCHHSNMKPMWFIYNVMKRNRSPEEWTTYKLQHGIDESVPPSIAPLPNQLAQP